MRRALTLLAAAVLGAAAAGGGFYAHRLLRPGAPADPIMATASVALPADAPATLAPPRFSLPDLDGRLRSPSEWAGKVLVINFWATWCPPCLHEIPVFNALQASLGERGLQFLGVAIDDLENVRRFADEQQMAYPSVHGQLDAIELGKQLGNRLGALPYTVFVGRDGNIAETHAGPLDRETAERMIEVLL